MTTNNIVINRSGGGAGALSNRRASLNGSQHNERSPLIGAANRQPNHETSLAINKSNVDMATGVSWGVAAFLLVNTALGAGMLNYPYAYNQIGGVVAAALIQVVSS